MVISHAKWDICIELSLKLACRIICSDCKKISESARMGSTDNSDGSNLVRSIGSPNNQLAISAGKVSAMNLQVLSYIQEFYLAPLLERRERFDAIPEKLSSL